MLPKSVRFLSIALVGIFIISGIKLTVHSPQFFELDVVEGGRVLGTSRYNLILSNNTLNVVGLPTGPYIEFTIEGGGIFVIGLYEKEAPQCAEHFRKLVANQLFADGSFYRADCAYVIQGGAYTRAKDKLNPFGSCPLEYRVPNAKRTVAFARPVDDSSGQETEFFINMGDNTEHLGPDGVASGGYTVFGKVISGFRNLQFICDQELEKDDHRANLLKHPVRIAGVRILSIEDAKKVILDPKLD